jgi:hypothetical protein
MFDLGIIFFEKIDPFLNIFSDHQLDLQSLRDYNQIGKSSWLQHFTVLKILPARIDT